MSARRVPRNVRPTAPWRGTLRASRCARICNIIEANRKLWLHLWKKELGASAKDRVYHEVSTLVEVLNQGGKYDQLNMGAVASLRSPREDSSPSSRRRRKGLNRPIGNPLGLTRARRRSSISLPMSCEPLRLVQQRTKRRSTV